ncbi:phosphoribosyl pyrophosphate synthase-associated protein 1-like isoform X1 [Sycon ciliatum]|uniref:phosphoribosyl pyrophosphate synthase-associated protein 1-like isoform X1 n=1 Tax=Sycon ciliatum TaxID=27933 RepID=UPI0020AAB379|eukprot:scpid37543/ scgid22974/ Phosphoribosyl pyrophosphate synthase-associated protein 1
MEFFCGTSHSELGKEICRRLGVDPSPLKCRFGGVEDDCESTCKETHVEIGTSVRGRRVFLLQTGSKDVNNSIMELLIMAYACKTACAEKIIAVIPYLPYSKQSKMRKRGSIPAKLFATLLSRAGVTHVVTMDLHTKEIQGFFDFPVDNLRSSSFLCKYIQEIPDYHNSVIVARRPESTKRATSFAERLKLNIAVIHIDQSKEADIDREDGRCSPPIYMFNEDGSSNTNTPNSSRERRVNTASRRTRTVSESSASATAGAAAAPAPMGEDLRGIKLVGDVSGRIAVIVDDSIDEVASLIRIANVLHHRGASRIYVVATHGIFIGNAAELLEESCIDEIAVTNTVPQEEFAKTCAKVKTIDISPLLSEAVRRIQNGESMSYLFRDISTYD